MLCIGGVMESAEFAAVDGREEGDVVRGRESKPTSARNWAAVGPRWVRKGKD